RQADSAIYAHEAIVPRRWRRDLTRTILSVMLSRTIQCASAIAALAVGAWAQTPPPRPKIVGVAHIGLRTDNLDAARKFYGEQLGYEEAFHLDKPEGGLMLIYFKVNDHQYIEVFPGWKGEEQLVLSHIAFETDNAQQ